jgi:class 3 adenylate cyclase
MPTEECSFVGIFFGDLVFVRFSREKQKRKLAAILSACAVEYGRLIGEDEAGTLQTLKGHRQAMCSLVEKHKGRVVDTRGDNLLAEFASVVNALECAVETQKERKRSHWIRSMQPPTRCWVRPTCMRYISERAAPRNLWQKPSN